MKQKLFILLILPVLSIGIFAQKAEKYFIPDEQNLRKSVSFLTSEKLEGRKTGEQGASLAAQYVAEMFKKYKLKPAFPNAEKNARFLQVFPYKQRNEKGEIAENGKISDGWNVVGILEGTDENLKNEAIVIGAHYDHLGRGGMGSLAVNSQEIHHGADDNSSGTAALLELARTFAKAKNNKRTIIFISFGGEEEGLLGSRHYVNNPVFPLEKTVAMLNMDMVGRLKDEKLTIGGIGTASEWKSLINSSNSVIQMHYIKEELTANDKPYKTISKAEAETLIAEKKAQPIFRTGTKNLVAVFKDSLRFQVQLNEDGFGPSDHSSFYGKQIPVLFFFTGTHLDYHKPSDTAEKINYDGLSQIADFVGKIAVAIDRKTTKPTYTVAKSSTQNDGRRGFSVTIGVIPGYGDSNDGMTLDGVRDGSPAAIAGLKSGDKIIKFAGKDVKNVQDYTKILGELKADIEYDIEVIRGAEKLSFKVKPATRK